MKYIIYVACLILLFTSLLSVTPKRLETQAVSPYIINNETIGLQMYGIQHKNFPCDRLIGALKDVPRINLAFMWGSFGLNNACLKRVIALPPASKHIEIHLINGSCIRMNRCDPRSEVLGKLNNAQFQQKLLKKDKALRAKIQKLSSDVAKFTKKYNSPKYYISPVLESDLNKAAAVELFKIVKPYFPDTAMVWNPVRRNKFKDHPEMNYAEDHMPKAVALKNRPCIIGWDGQDISFDFRPSPQSIAMLEEKVEKTLEKYKRCELTLLWASEFNGTNLKGSWVKPLDRKYFPSQQLLDAFKQWLPRKDPIVTYPPNPPTPPR
jgi:hypothetical protein